MTSTALSNVTLPAEKEVEAAVQGQRALAAFLATGFETQRIQIFDEKNQAHQVELPTSALRLLVDILSELSNGNAVRVVPVHAELTTQEAADMLNISRPSLIQLLDGGKIDYRRVGTHRRVRFEALMKFKRQADADRKAALAELAAYDRELGI